MTRFKDIILTLIILIREKLWGNETKEQSKYILASEEHRATKKTAFETIRNSGDAHSWFLYISKITV